MVLNPINCTRLIISVNTYKALIPICSHKTVAHWCLVSGNRLLLASKFWEDRSRPECESHLSQHLIWTDSFLPIPIENWVYLWSRWEVHNFSSLKLFLCIILDTKQTAWTNFTGDSCGGELTLIFHSTRKLVPQRRPKNNLAKLGIPATQSSVSHKWQLFDVCKFYEKQEDRWIKTRGLERRSGSGTWLSELSSA